MHLAGMFGVDGGIVKVWDTLLLTLTLLDAFGWHVWAGRRHRQGMGHVFADPKPYYINMPLAVWGGRRHCSGMGDIVADSNPTRCTWLACLGSMEVFSSM